MFGEVGATIGAGTPAGAGARRLGCGGAGLAAERQVRWATAWKSHRPRWWRLEVRSDDRLGIRSAFYSVGTRDRVTLWRWEHVEQDSVFDELGGRAASRRGPRVT